MSVPIGFRHSDATRLLMSQKRKGRKLTPEHSANISKGMTGRVTPRLWRPCVNCGMDFPMVPAQKYCSRNCNAGASGKRRIHSPAFAEFERKCAVCGTTDLLVGDHDHATEQPRGILCRNCNIGLGNFRDDPSLLRAAAGYIEGGA